MTTVAGEGAAHAAARGALAPARRPRRLRPLWPPRAGRLARQLGAVLALLPAAAAAHDTWLAARPAARTGELRLALGTGDRYPLQESGVARDTLVTQGCRGADGRTRPMQARRDTAHALELVLPAPGAAQTCWAQTASATVVLTPAQAAVYLDEIRAPAPVRERAAQLAARGVAWQETFSKHARLEWGHRHAAPRPVPMALDIVPDDATPTVGQPWSATVLRDGRPLPQFSVQLVNADAGIGLWLRTDDAGRVQLRPTLAGEWLLRGTDLRPHPAQTDGWESRFVTLALRVLPARAAPRRAPAPDLRAP